MTDLAPIVITASVLTIILQIVLIMLVVDSKKKTKVVAEEKPVHHEIREPRKPRENDTRFPRKPPQDQRVKPIAPAPAPTQHPDQMERSLRDINLRLKNAENDQEKERRRIKDTLGNQPQQKRNDFSRQRDRNEGFRRNERQPRQDNQNRTPAEPFKPVVREEKPIRPPMNIEEPKEVRIPVIAPVVATPTAPVATPQAPIVTPVESKAKPTNQVFEIESTGIATSDNLQHGRKVAVKRRVLKEELEGSEQAAEMPISGVTSSSSTSSANEPTGNTPESNQPINPVTSLESNSSDNAGSSGPISFGR